MVGTPLGVGGGETVAGLRADLLRVKGNPPRDAAAVFELALVTTSHVKVGIYDLAGRRLRLLYDGLLEAGRHDIHWDGRDQAGDRAKPGVYLVQARNVERGTIVGTRLTFLR